MGDHGWEGHDTEVASVMSQETRERSVCLSAMLAKSLVPMSDLSLTLGCNDFPCRMASLPEQCVSWHMIFLTFSSLPICMIQLVASLSLTRTSKKILMDGTFRERATSETRLPEYDARSE